MPSSSYCLLYLEKTAWQLIGEQERSERATFAADDLVEQAQPILAALPASKPLVLGLSADWCLSATIDIISPQMLRKPALIHNQLEEWIPWTAEEFVSDFIGHKDHAFCVAVRHQQLAVLLDALEAEDILIAAVVPLPLLALEEHLQTEKLEDHRLLWQDENTVDLLTIRQGQLERWSRAPANMVEVTRHLQTEKLTLGTDLPIYTRGSSLEIEEATQLSADSQIEAATRTSQAILAGEHESAIKLRQAELRGKQSFEVLGPEIKRLKLTVTLLAICVAAALWFRASHYQEAVAEVQEDLADTHEEVFPGVEPPERIGVAFSKEYRQLRGTRAPTEELPAPIAADTVLENGLTASARENEVSLARDSYRARPCYFRG